jgi:hypothetical protein
MEGFENTYTKLYDDTGAVVSSAAIVGEGEVVTRRQEATKSEKKPAANSTNQCCTIS